MCVCVCVDKRTGAEKLSATQALLTQHEESLRRADRDRRALNERIKELERLSLNTETERKRVEVRLILSQLTPSRDECSIDPEQNSITSHCLTKVTVV